MTNHSFNARTPNDRVDLYTRAVLTVIAILLALLVLRPSGGPPAALAQSDYSHLYIEPQTTLLRSPEGFTEIQGKVAIDLRNGNVWGFPTRSAVPYPVDQGKSEPPISKPMYLGRFDFSATNRVP